MYPKSRYAAEGVCSECHVDAWQYALHKSVELSASFDSWPRALAGTNRGTRGGNDRCIFGIERMYRDMPRRCAVCGRSFHIMGSFLANMATCRSRCFCEPVQDCVGNPAT